MPSRATQPFRKGVARQPGLALKAMKRGRTALGGNPMDVQRAIAKGGNAPRQMAKPVAPPKGKPAAAPATKGGFSKFTLHKNATGNERDGQAFRTVAGISKGGAKGEYHVYGNGRRVFVASKATARFSAKAKAARGRGVG